MWGDSVKPDDDLWLDFDVWATANEGGSSISADETWTMHLRNEISAMANKIEPNGNPGGRWFNDDPTTIRKEFELGGPEVLTLEQIERRTLEAVGARRIMIRFPMALLRLVVRLMETTLRNPPVTRSLLELLAVSNVTSDNALTRFVEAPRAFTAEAASEYMSEFRVSETLRQYFRR